ncbi:hypothetical protein OG216_38615 [Streptomycetaceae bacterium NBC_01309]
MIDRSFGSGATADIERVYRGSGGVTVVNLMGLGHTELVKRMDSYTDTLRGKRGRSRTRGTGTTKRPARRAVRRPPNSVSGGT